MPICIPGKKDLENIKHNDLEKLKVIKKHAQKELNDITKRNILSPYNEGRKNFLNFILKAKTFAGLSIESFPEAIKEIKDLPFMEDYSLPAAYEDKEWLKIYYNKAEEKVSASKYHGKKGGEKSGEQKKGKAKTIHITWQILANELWKKRPHLSIRNVAHQIAKKNGGNTDTIRRSIRKIKELDNSPTNTLTD